MSDSDAPAAKRSCTADPWNELPEIELIDDEPPENAPPTSTKTWKVDSLTFTTIEKAVDHLKKCKNAVKAPAWWKMWDVESVPCK